MNEKCIKCKYFSENIAAGDETYCLHDNCMGDNGNYCATHHNCFFECRDGHPLDNHVVWTCNSDCPHRPCFLVMRDGFVPMVGCINLYSNYPDKCQWRKTSGEFTFEPVRQEET